MNVIRILGFATIGSFGTYVFVMLRRDRRKVVLEDA